MECAESGEYIRNMIHESGETKTPGANLFQGRAEGRQVADQDRFPKTE